MDEYADITLSCRDCGEDFIFSADDQAYFAERGFENQPTRCRPCQKAKKERFNGGGGNVCYAYQAGNCDRGESCRFAHSEDGSGYQPRPRGVCYAWQEGTCDRGDSCRFAHSDEPTESTFSSGFGGGRRPRGVCYAWQEGTCDRGDSCRFAHSDDGSAGAPRPRGVCYAWQEGTCERGESCRFAHEE